MATIAIVATIACTAMTAQQCKLKAQNQCPSQQHLAPVRVSKAKHEQQQGKSKQQPQQEQHQANRSAKATQITTWHMLRSAKQSNSTIISNTQNQARDHTHSKKSNPKPINARLSHVTVSKAKQQQKKHRKPIHSKAQQHLAHVTVSQAEQQHKAKQRNSNTANATPANHKQLKTQHQQQHQAKANQSQPNQNHNTITSQPINSTPGTCYGQAITITINIMRSKAKQSNAMQTQCISNQSKRNANALLINATQISAMQGASTTQTSKHTTKTMQPHNNITATPRAIKTWYMLRLAKATGTQHTQQTTRTLKITSKPKQQRKANHSNTWAHANRCIANLLQTDANNAKDAKDANEATDANDAKDAQDASKSNATQCNANGMQSMQSMQSMQMHSFAN